MKKFHWSNKSARTIVFLMIMGVAWLSTGCGRKVNLKKFDGFNAYNEFLDSLAIHSPQFSNDSLVLDNISGLRQEEFDFFCSEGYAVDVKTMNQPLDEQLLGEIKTKYEITKNFALDTIKENYLRYIQEELNDSIKVITIYYIIGIPGSRTSIVSYRTSQSRNSKFELKFNNLVIRDSIPDECLSHMVVDSIRFAGRYIHLGPACEWKGVNNIQCSGMGQMNWCEFQDFSGAVEMIRVQLATSRTTGHVKTAECIPVLFEGNQTKALRLKYKIALPKVVLGGSNNIVAYYVVSSVRNRYVGCVISHYEDEAREGELPALLSEVMKLN